MCVCVNKHRGVLILGGKILFSERTEDGKEALSVLVFMSSARLEIEGVSMALIAACQNGALSADSSNPSACKSAHGTQA